MSHVAWSVCVGHTVVPCKNVEMPFRALTHVGSKNHVSRYHKGKQQLVDFAVYGIYKNG